MDKPLEGAFQVCRSGSMDPKESTIGINKEKERQGKKQYEEPVTVRAGGRMI